MLNKVLPMHLQLNSNLADFRSGCETVNEQLLVAHLESNYPCTSVILASHFPLGFFLTPEVALDTFLELQTLCVGSSIQRD